MRKRKSRTLVKRTIHDNIRRRRETLGLSQQELADRIAELTGGKTGKSHVSHWERGRAAPRWNIIPAVADALVITVAELHA